MPQASRSFSAAPSAVGDARRFLLELLQDWSGEGFEFGGPLVLTELVTNAVLHAHSPYEVRLSLLATHLVVEVHDTSPRLPLRRHYELDATTGRGMTLVSTLCSDWGVEPTAGGKVVWAHVRPDEWVEAQEPDDVGMDRGVTTGHRDVADVRGPRSRCGCAHVVPPASAVAA
jgi:anti-sigma regulatory factor (Ser/Thr protein kinase)